jgi:hypothetical protein
MPGDTSIVPFKAGTRLPQLQDLLPRYIVLIQIAHGCTLSHESSALLKLLQQDWRWVAAMVFTEAVVFGIASCCSTSPPRTPQDHLHIVRSHHQVLRLTTNGHKERQHDAGCSSWLEWIVPAAYLELVENMLKALVLVLALT